MKLSINSLHFSWSFIIITIMVFLLLGSAKALAATVFGTCTASKVKNSTSASQTTTGSASTNTSSSATATDDKYTVTCTGNTICESAQSASGNGLSSQAADQAVRTCQNLVYTLYQSDHNHNYLVNTLCNVLRIVTGNGGKAFAAFAIISLGIGFFTGKVSWGLMVGVAAGIAAMFGAPTVVAAITGQDAYDCSSSRV